MNSILTVTTPASSYDLTALATVKTELGITDNTENDKLRTWITQASIIAASYCRRVFARETLTETFRPARNCSSHVGVSDPAAPPDRQHHQRDGR
jgi:hypothetical protein